MKINYRRKYLNMAKEIIDSEREIKKDYEATLRLLKTIESKSLIATGNIYDKASSFFSLMRSKYPQVKEFYNFILITNATKENAFINISRKETLINALLSCKYGIISYALINEEIIDSYIDILESVES